MLEEERGSWICSGERQPPTAATSAEAVRTLDLVREGPAPAAHSLPVDPFY